MRRQMVEVRQAVAGGGGARGLQRQQRAHGARLRVEGGVGQRAPARAQPARRHPVRVLLLLQHARSVNKQPTYLAVERHFWYKKQLTLSRDTPRFVFIHYNATD